MLPILKGLVDEKVLIVKKFNYLVKRHEMNKLAFFVKSSSNFRLRTSDSRQMHFTSLKKT